MKGRRRDIRGCVFQARPARLAGDRVRHPRHAAGRCRRQGIRVSRPALLHEPALDRSRSRPGAGPAILATLYLGVLAAARDGRASGRRDGGLPRGVRGQASLVQPAARGQHPEPRRRAVDRLRDPRARVYRARPRPRPRPARGWTDPDAARAADGDHRRARSDPRSARLDSPGRLRARRDALAGRLAPGAAGRDSRASPPARSSRSRAGSARPLRCS